MPPYDPAAHAHPDERLLTREGGLEGVARLRAITHRLRAPGGCPWDAEQTHRSLLPNLIEETHEVADTIRRDDHEHLKEELGDLLLQVVFHSELGEEADRFDLEEVAHGICDKLVRRHPHVFGEKAGLDTEAVLRQWDAIKREEKAGKGEERADGRLDGVGRGLSALMRAAKLQKKAAKVGFDWPDTPAVLEKVREELGEVEVELGRDDQHKLADEIGDLLFSVVNVARKAGEDPELLLDAANGKFVDRFHAMERALTDSGRNLEGATIEEMEAAWQAAKSGDELQ